MRQKGTDTGEKRPSHTYSDLESSLETLLFIKNIKYWDGAHTHCPTRGLDDLSNTWQQE